MASPNTLTNLTGFIDGVEADEDGINIERFRCEIEPEFDTYIPDKYGAARGEVQGPMKLDVSVQGEVSDDTAGVMVSVLGVAYAFANTTAWFGAPTTGLYLKKAAVEQERTDGKLRHMDGNWSARAGIA